MSDFSTVYVCPVFSRGIKRVTTKQHGRVAVPYKHLNPTILGRRIPVLDFDSCEIQLTDSEKERAIKKALAPVTPVGNDDKLDQLIKIYEQYTQLIYGKQSIRKAA